MRGVAIGAALSYAGLPIYSAHARMMVAQVGDLNKFTRKDLHHFDSWEKEKLLGLIGDSLVPSIEERVMSALERPVSVEARIGFFFNTGITPEYQLLIERMIEAST